MFSYGKLFFTEVLTFCKAYANIELVLQKTNKNYKYKQGRNHEWPLQNKLHPYQGTKPLHELPVLKQIKNLRPRAEIFIIVSLHVYEDLDSIHVCEGAGFWESLREAHRLR